jgi:Rod binding domain-containing protein
MDLKPLHSQRVEAANLSLDRIAASTQVPESEKVTEVCRAFEAVLLRQILSESQRPVFQSKSTGNSTTDSIYRDMIVNQMAEDISKSGSFGVGKSLARELQHQVGAAKPAAPEQLSPRKSHLENYHHE